MHHGSQRVYLQKSTSSFHGDPEAHTHDVASMVYILETCLEAPCFPSQSTAAPIQSNSSISTQNLLDWCWKHLNWECYHFARNKNNIQLGTYCECEKEHGRTCYTWWQGEKVRKLPLYIPLGCIIWGYYWFVMFFLYTMQEPLYLGRDYQSFNMVSTQPLRSTQSQWEYASYREVIFFSHPCGNIGTCSWGRLGTCQLVCAHRSR